MANKFAGGVKAGSVDVSLPVTLNKTSDGTELTAVAAGSVTASYWRQGGVRTAIAVSALGSLNAAHADGGWAEVDATNVPGKYRLDVPDAAFVAGADWVNVSVKVASAYLFDLDVPLETIGAADLLNQSIDGSLTMKQLLAVVGANAAGNLTGGRTGLEVIAAAGNGAQPRITSANDANGNRTNTLTLTGL